MNDIYVTLTGNIAAEPRQHTFDDGTRVTSLRLATRHRYFDRKAQTWVDGETVYFAVRCWRGLGDNVVQSVRAGQPVIVSGRLRIREFGAEGARRFMPEVEATAIGHDLRWGLGAFSKPERAGLPGGISAEHRERLDEDTRDWALGTAGRYSSRPTAAQAEETTVRVLGAAENEESSWPPEPQPQPHAA